MLVFDDANAASEVLSRLKEASLRAAAAARPAPKREAFLPVSVDSLSAPAADRLANELRAALKRVGAPMQADSPPS